jgi:hypothetical protein
MGGAVSTHGREKQKGRDHTEDLGVDGKLILEWILNKWSGKVDWTHLAQYRDQWREFVNTVMNVRVP